MLWILNTTRELFVSFFSLGKVTIEGLCKNLSLFKQFSAHTFLDTNLKWSQEPVCAIFLWQYPAAHMQAEKSASWFKPEMELKVNKTKR